MNILFYVKISGSAAFNSPGNTCKERPFFSSSEASKKLEIAQCTKKHSEEYCFQEIYVSTLNWINPTP